MRDGALLTTAADLVAQERTATTQVLECINEIELRRLHLQLGHSSLHEFLVKHLGYSDGGAHRRIAAARLLKALPEVVAPALKDGRMNLTTIALAQDFLVSEKRDFKKSYSIAEKENLLSSIASKSRRQCEEIFQTISPERATLPRPEKVRLVGGTASSVEVLLTMGPEFQEKLTRVKELLSHHPESQKNYAALFELMADQLLKKLRPGNNPAIKTGQRNSIKEEASRQLDSDSIAAPRPNAAVAVCKNPPESTNARSASQPVATSPGKFSLPMDLALLAQQQNQKIRKNRDLKESSIRVRTTRGKASRYIPIHIKNFVRVRDQDQCSFVSATTHQRCTERNFLHIDHIHPLALGGKTTRENCRLLCSQHNSLMAIHKFGMQKMGRYSRTN